MPKVTGKEVAHKLRQKGIMIPIIGVSAASTQEEIEKFLIAGHHTNIEVMAKPFDFNRIIKVGISNAF